MQVSQAAKAREALEDMLHSAYSEEASWSLRTQRLEAEKAALRDRVEALERAREADARERENCRAEEARLIARVQGLEREVLCVCLSKFSRFVSMLDW